MQSSCSLTIWCSLLFPAGCSKKCSMPNFMVRPSPQFSSPITQMHLPCLFACGEWLVSSDLDCEFSAIWRLFAKEIRFVLRNLRYHFSHPGPALVVSRDDGQNRAT